MRRRSVAAAAAAFLTPALAGSLVALALATLPSDAVGAADFPFSVRDATGINVTIPAAPLRIVSLAPSVTEILFALGLDAQIVGIGDADDFPPDRVRTKARVGGVLINLERVVALHPDLIIGVPSLQRDQLMRLRTIQLRVLAVDAASIDETVAQIRLLGRATGKVREAEDLAMSIGRRAQVVKPMPRVSVYIEVWNEPITVAGGGTLIQDLVRRAGGSNIFEDRRGYVQVPLETVLVRNPQVIFLLYPGRDSMLSRPGWRALAAARDGRIYELSPSLVSRPGPRIVDGLAAVSRLLAGAR